MTRLSRTARLLLAVLLGATYVVGHAHTAGAAAPEVTGVQTDLGIAIPGKVGSVRSEQSAQGVLSDGRYLAFFASSGGPGTAARLLAMDLDGQLAASVPIPDGTDVLGLGYSPTSKTVFLAANGSSTSYLYEYDGTALRRVATIAGHIVMRLAVAPDGAVYLGTFAPGNGRLFAWSGGTLRDLGQPVAGESYVRAVVADASAVWVSNYRQAGARLVRVDRSTGGFTAVAAPAAFSGEWGALDLSRAGDHLLIRTGNGNYLFAYDTVAARFVPLDDQVDRVSGEEEVPRLVPYVEGISPYGISPLVEGRYVYFQRSRAGIMRIDLLDGLKTVRVDKYNAGDNPVSWPAASVPGPVSYAWLSGVGGRSGSSLVTTTIDGKVYINSPRQTAPLVRALPVEDAPSTIISLGRDDAGNVLSGGFDLPAGVGRYDSASGTSSLLTGPQIEGFGTFDGTTVLGGYTGTTPSGPLYTWSGSGQPVLRTHLGNDQERPVAIVQVGRKVAIGSVPVKNTLGGALSIWDPGTGALVVERDLVPDHSIVSLAVHEGLIVGGSSNAGGTGATPTATDGQIFTYDVATGAVKTFRPPRLTSATYSWVAAITPDPVSPGHFWALSTGILIQFRVAADGSVVLTKNLGVFPGTSSPTGKGLGIAFVRDTLFATLSGTLSAVNPTTGERAVVADATDAGPVVGVVAQGDDLYYARGAQLYRYRVASAVTTTTLAAPRVTSHDLSQPQAPGAFAFSGTGTKNATITLTHAGRVRSTVVPDSGVWTLGAMDFGYGTHDLVLSASLPGLSTVTTSAVMSVRDTSAGVCAMSSAVPTNVVRDGYNAPYSDYAFTGTGVPGTTVQTVSGTRTRTATVRSDGTWLMSALPFGWWAGDLPFTVSAPGCPSQVDRVRLTFATAPSTHAAPSLLTHTSTTWYAAGDVVFSGKGTPGAVVTLRVGTQTRQAAASTTGRWHMRALTVGPAPVTLQLSSSVPGFPDRASSVDVHFGAAPTRVTAPSLTSPVGSGPHPSGAITFSGKGTPSSKITLSHGDRTWTTFVRSTGRWDLRADVLPGTASLVFVASSPGLPSASTPVTMTFG